MPNWYNIDKSAFQKGAYVGYAGGLVYRIRKDRGRWVAVCTNPKPDTNRDDYWLTGKTLTAISFRLQGIHPQGKV